MAQIPTFFKFKRFYAFFPTFSTDFVDWKGQQGENVLSSTLFRRVYCTKCLKLTPKMTKNTKFPIFEDFMHFPNFRQTSSFGTLERVNKERKCCPVYLEKRQMQFFKRKLSGIDNEKDKISKFSRFSLFLFNFCQNIGRPRGLKCLNA